jgi:ABC-type nitrate/sulfonate/bicarbonate transport system permease component
MTAASIGRRPSRYGLGVLTAVLHRWLVLVVGVAAWELGTRTTASAYFPPPSKIVARMYHLWFAGPASRLFLTPNAMTNVVPSLTRMGIGLAASVVTGVALGIALGRSERAFEYLDPLFQFARVIPPPTLVPVFIVLFKVGAQMQVASIIFSAIWPVLLNTADGARSVDQLQMATARVFKLSAADRLFKIIVPSTLPKIFAGLRLSLSLSLILMVFSELLPGTANGIGFELTDAQSRSDLPSMWAGIVLLGVLGYVLNTVLLVVERRVLAWHRTSRGTDN